MASGAIFPVTLEVRNLFKSYQDKKVLQGLNLSVHAGETLVILGRSGSGKSVLLRLMLGLETPDAGEVLIEGVSLFALPEYQRMPIIRSMGMLFQAGALFDSLTVAENTAFYLRQHGKPPHHIPYTEQEIQEEVARALALVDLAGTQELLPSDLSGGMRKRAALARLLVYRPKIILYDEPTTGLDPITAMQINELIIQVQKELGATSVVVTHDLCSTFRVADRIALNVQGRIVHTTTKEEFVTLEDPIVQSFLKNSTPLWQHP